MPIPTIVTKAHRPVIAALVQEGLTNQQIQHELSTHHDVHCLLSTIARARSNWNLQIRPNAETQDFKNDLITFYHGQGFVAEHLIAILEERHGFSISQRTLARRCKSLGLQRRKDDVDQGRVTLDDIANLIQHAKQRADGKRAGYRRVHHILRNQYRVSVHREFVTAAQDSLHILPAAINMETAWPAFHKILAFMRAYDAALLEIPADQPRAPTNHEQAVIAVHTRFGRLPR
ncbi:uncharacterized protein MELLADRAFT_110057 [Melampsora larici-populina 98AG31]|uniref:Uncharacterized protein n=1 Tax=Melampsora larici-populina (strain 98AG31 / pathotype 3-4-7) TaxID=747676 RepID=F4RYI4_MELLP|nr:uncharacterized protein MELLADRAFT_110057 [Melampsora larici-populina 98AG31]EGG02477.1 hypothetical protein MELLADRAFT_110057 [Melampsora larici-populina 98AG31]